eukprot:TRINITY_DN14000_c0_g1_i1.p1 TRINITY_DN14000_c0_g1~~TRINITY_DN14000_c0_g1_i1.p1  ORF type:complete len:255 (-),score=30.77 TRINITY_DN14000_c0_g1_i1:56-775(-)
MEPPPAGSFRLADDTLRNALCFLGFDPPPAMHLIRSNAPPRVPIGVTTEWLHHDLELFLRLRFVSVQFCRVASLVARERCRLAVQQTLPALTAAQAALRVLPQQELNDLRAVHLPTTRTQLVCECVLLLMRQPEAAAWRGTLRLLSHPGVRETVADWATSDLATDERVGAGGRKLVQKRMANDRLKFDPYTTLLPPLLPACRCLLEWLLAAVAHLSAVHCGRVVERFTALVAWDELNTE